MVNFNPSSWGSLLGGILNPNRQAGSASIWNFIKDPTNYDPRFVGARTLAPSTPTYAKSSSSGGGYNGSVNAFSSSPKGKFIGDSTSPWDSIAASVAAKSSLPGDDFVDPYAGLDPEAMVRREFDPQYSLISQMEGQAKKRYTAAGNDIGLGWDLLAKSLAGGEKGIKAATTARGKDIKKGWGDVSAKSDASLDAARADLIERAKRNGTEETIAPLLAKLATEKADLQSQTGAREGNWAGFNAQMGENEVQNNRMAANNATWGGIGARADFASRLQGALDELGNRRLQTKANEGGAFNKYSMDLAQGRQSAKSAWETLQTQRAAQAMQLEQQSAAKEIDPSKLTPSEFLAYTAKGLYGNERAAQNAAQAIQDTIIHSSGGFKDAKAFVDAVLARNKNAFNPGGDVRQLSQLALDYYNKIAGGTNKGVGNAAYGTMG
jgi:hypothetical protein